MNCPAEMSEASDHEPKITLKVAATQAGPTLVSVRSEAAPGRAGEIAEVLLWWTLPDGKTTSIVIRPVDDGVWATPVTLNLQPGRQRLTLLVIGRKAGGIESIREQRYTLDFPGLKLEKEEEKVFAALGQDASKTRKSVAAGDEGEKGSPASQALDSPDKPKSGGIVLLVFMAGLVLALLGAAGYAGYRYLPSSRRKRGLTTVLNQEVKDPAKKDETAETEDIEAAAEQIEPTDRPPATESHEPQGTTLIEEPAETATVDAPATAQTPDAPPAANMEKTENEEPAEPEVSEPAEPAPEEPLSEPILVPADRDEPKVNLKDLSF